MEKPHRFLLDRVASYAEEGAAYLRRRKLRERPYVRVWDTGGGVRAVDPESEPGERLRAVAVSLFEEDERLR